jgi:hypothetical protein
MKGLDERIDAWYPVNLYRQRGEAAAIHESCVADQESRTVSHHQQSAPLSLTVGA